jgi:hypothetical protein
LKGNEMSVRVPVPIATHYADPDDVEAAMRGLHDLEARDRADGAPSDEVGCGRPGDARKRVARVRRAIPRAPAPPPMCLQLPVHCSCVNRR